MRNSREQRKRDDLVVNTYLAVSDMETYAREGRCVAGKFHFERYRDLKSTEESFGKPYPCNGMECRVFRFVVPGANPPEGSLNSVIPNELSNLSQGLREYVERALREFKGDSHGKRK